MTADHRKAIGPDAASRRAALGAGLAVGLGAAAALAGLAPPAAAAGHATTMSVKDARAAAQSGALTLIDVRRPEEWAESGVPDVARPIDMRDPDFLGRVAAIREADPDGKIGFICATGMRSGYVAQYLRKAGMTNIVDVSAGVHGRPDGWLARGLPVKPAP